ncbi:MAG: Asd/ArgC dimerization domain-containing protein [Pseudomonadota bacterium]
MQHVFALSHPGSPAGEAILEKLEESGISPDSLILLDEETLVGTRYRFGGTHLKSLDKTGFDYSGCSVLLMPEADPLMAQEAISAGCLLVSHQSGQEAEAHLCEAGQSLDLGYSDTTVNLVGPELACILPVLSALNRWQSIVRVNTVLMRSAEFYGKTGVDELASQTVSLLNAREIQKTVYREQIAFNLIPEPSGESISTELDRFIGNDKNMVQMVNIPFFHGFAASIQLEFESDVGFEACKEQIESIQNVTVKAQPATPISDCNQSFSCVISLLEQPQDRASSLQFWLIADPMRYGIANNYVNVADFLLKSFL